MWLNIKKIAGQTGDNVALIGSPNLLIQRISGDC